MSEAQNGEAPNETNKPSIPSKRHEEYQYLDLVREILDDGEHRPDRCEPPLWIDSRMGAVFLKHDTDMRPIELAPEHSHFLPLGH
jgi:hypothetical protein